MASVPCQLQLNSLLQITCKLHCTSALHSAMLMSDNHVKTYPSMAVLLTLRAAC